MSKSGLDAFDTTLQLTHVWLNEIGEDIGPDTQRCYHALRAVLHVLRDRLSTDEAAHLAAELPMLIRGIYYEGYHPSGKPEAIDTDDQFLQRVAVGLEGMRPIDPENAARAVFKVLRKHVSEGEMNQLEGSLPKDLRRLLH